MYVDKAAFVFAILALQICVVSCLGGRWWSIAAEPSVFDQRNPTTPRILGCSGFNSTHLCSEQRVLCRSDPKLLSVTAIGVLQALNQCQKLFKDRPWNCSVFNPVTSPYYLGRFIERGTRETAFLNAIISAGIAREIARKCKEQQLDSCNCDFSVQSASNGNSRNVSGCGDNSRFGVLTAESFTDSCLPVNDANSLVELHNNKVGRQLVEVTEVACVCHGVSGSCSVRTCFTKVQDVDQLGQKLLILYDVSKHVKKIGNVLKPVEARVPPLINSELAHLTFSPSFCERNLTYGIYGTSGRRCYPDRSGPNNCATMCCGHTAIQRVVEVKEDESICCEFVWCCHLDCSKCTTHDEIHYYCP